MPNNCSNILLLLILLLPVIHVQGQEVSSSQTEVVGKNYYLTQPNPSILFLKKLLKTPELSPCSLMTFQDRYDNEESVTYILRELGHTHSYFTVKYTFPTEDHIPSTNISSILSSTSALPVHYPITVSNYHKRGDQCLVVLLFISDLRPSFMKQISNLLTPVYIPITRKDLDYFILFAPEQILDNVLLMQELPARIKFKLGLSHDQDAFRNKEMQQPLTRESLNQPTLIVKTVCFFCKAGQPQIIQFPSEFNPQLTYFPDFVINLNGRILHVSCPYIRARIEADPPWTGINNARRGYWKNLFEEYLTVKFNFSYHIFVSTGKDGGAGGGTGVMLFNGTWIGVTGDLVSGKADLGIVTANTPKRIRYIDFTHSFFDFGYLTYVTSEGARVFSPLALLWPLDIIMWASIGISILVAFVFFTLIIKAIFWLDIASGDSLTFARRGMISTQIWNLKYQIQFVMTSFLDQDCVLPTSTPLRTFVAIWLFFTLVLTTIYRSKLVSLLAFPLIESLPTDFDQLAYSSYKVGFMKHGDSAYNTLAASTDPVYVKLLKEMEIVNGVGLECLEKVVTQKYGCIAYDFALRHLRERNLSESDTRRLVFAPAHTYNIFLGIATEGKSIYRINFGKWLSYTRAFHFNDIWEQRDMYYTVRLLKRSWWFATGQGEKAKMTFSFAGDDNLTLKHISGSFYILIALLVICSLSFIAELCHFYRKKWSDSKPKKKNASKGCCSKLNVLMDKMFVLSRTEMDAYT